MYSNVHAQVMSRTQATSKASQVTYLPRPSLPPVFDLFLHTASDQTLLGSEARLIGYWRWEGLRVRLDSLGTEGGKAWE